MTIGEKIRELRKENNITQEKLGEYLNISYQAISKWENGSSLPDISLVVPIANFFGVSTDVLFDLDRKAFQEEILQYDREGMRLSNAGRVSDAIRLWEGAVSQFPKSYHCLINLAYSLLQSRNCDEINHELQIKQNLEKAVSICERILSDCTHNEERSSAVQILVLIYGHGPLQHEEKAVETAGKAAPLIVSRELLLLHAYNGEKRKKQRHDNSLSFIDLLCSNLTHDRFRSNEEYIAAFETAWNVYQLMFPDGNYLFYHCRVADIHKGLAKFYAKQQNKEKVMEHLEAAKKHAASYDAIPEGEQYYTSLFLNMATHNNQGTAKNFSYSHLDGLKEESKQGHFDFMRGDPRFTEFLNSF
ncbi:MAG: hypothetical protein BGN88_08985 [Clostridiales bacterium 43-6]|nr:MAG: hypothetical protein BGN88_08985 [Clostridiales bacterium 43-6]